MASCRSGKRGSARAGGVVARLLYGSGTLGFLLFISILHRGAFRFRLFRFFVGQGGVSRLFDGLFRRFRACFQVHPGKEVAGFNGFLDNGFKTLPEDHFPCFEDCAELVGRDDVEGPAVADADVGRFS